MTELGWTIHPGIHWQEAIDESDLTQAAVADLMGISAKHLNQICRGHVLPSAEHTVAFAKLLNLPVGMMWNLRANYELDIALGKTDLTGDYL